MGKERNNERKKRLGSGRSWIVYNRDSVFP